MWTVLGILEILLGLRFLLKLIAANASSGFATFIYGITGAFTAPFNSLLGTPAPEGSTFEVTTLIAMAVCALLFWVILRVIQIATDRSTARTVTRSTREETCGGPGNERTTHTLSRANPVNPRGFESATPDSTPRPSDRQIVSSSSGGQPCCFNQACLMASPSLSAGSIS